MLKNLFDDQLFFTEGDFCVKWICELTVAADHMSTDWNSLQLHGLWVQFEYMNTLKMGPFPISIFPNNNRRFWFFFQRSFAY